MKKEVKQIYCKNCGETVTAQESSKDWEYVTYVCPNVDKDGNTHIVGKYTVLGHISRGGKAIVGFGLAVGSLVAIIVTAGSGGKNKKF